MTKKEQVVKTQNISLENQQQLIINRLTHMELKLSNLLDSIDFYMGKAKTLKQEKIIGKHYKKLKELEGWFNEL